MSTNIKYGDNLEPVPDQNMAAISTFDPLVIVKGADNFPHNIPRNNPHYKFQLAKLFQFFLPDDPRPQGYILDRVVAKMPWTADFKIDHAKKEVHLLCRPVKDWESTCQRAVGRLLDLARAKNVFHKLEKKCDEKLPIIGAKFSLGIERSASALFGNVARGVHMTI